MFELKLWQANPEKSATRKNRKVKGQILLNTDSAAEAVSKGAEAIAALTKKQQEAITEMRITRVQEDASGFAFK